jgi:multiple sugar transport system ATP-binding protein
MAEIVLRNIEKHFGAAYVIRKLNLTIRPQGVRGAARPSGCGKTTTLRAIAGLEEIDSGDILIDGEPVQQLEAGDRDIAFVFPALCALSALDGIREHRLSPAGDPRKPGER